MGYSQGRIWWGLRVGLGILLANTVLRRETYQDHRCKSRRRSSSM